MSRKTSPWARATSSKSASGVSRRRVRTTSSGAAPASASAASDDLEAASGLAVGVGRRIGAVGHDRDRPRDEHAVADAHGAGEADDGLPGRAGRDVPTFHGPSSIARPMAALQAIDGWPPETAAAGVAAADGVLERRGPADRALPWASVTKLLTASAVLVARGGGHPRAGRARGPARLDRPSPPRARVGASAGRRGADREAGRAADLLQPGLRGARRARRGAGGDAVRRLPPRRRPRPGRALRDDARGLARATARTARSRTCSASGRELLDPRFLARETLDEATSVAFPGLAGVLPGFGRQEPNDWGLGFELRDAKSPHWTGARNSPRTFGHFGRSGTFLWVDPDAGLALAVLTDLDFGDWAAEAWPALSDAVLEELSP